MVCLVGPNEAGKTTLLQALSRLNSEAPLRSSELSRRRRPAARQDVLTATYLVEDDDRLGLGDVRGTSELRWLVVGKRADGTLTADTVPRLLRDRQVRTNLLSALRRARRLRRIRDADSVETENEEVGLTALLDSLEEAVAADEEDLGRQALELAEQIRTVLDAISAEDQSETLERLQTALVLFSAAEAQEHPGETARRHLMNRRPPILEISADDRELRSEYSIEELRVSVPSALSSVFAAAGLRFPELLQAIDAEDLGRAESMLSEASSQLSDHFREWNQSELQVLFRKDGDALRVLVSTEANSLLELRDRSAGLRAFIALTTFIARHSGTEPPILIIDELEEHLHYAAQADIVAVLGAQESAAQVFYTTHSAGCLPEDLGTGVRVVTPSDDGTSDVSNSFWTEGPGLTPLMLAMGMSASALAFSPARRVVLTEGGADLVLLPAMMREAAGLSRLGFQVAPGLAEANRDALSDLDLEASIVAYITDADDGGAQIRRRLLSSGIDEARVLALGEDDSGTVIEDLVKPDLYVAAVNDELGRSGFDQRISVDDVSAPSRPRSVRAWCEARGIKEPNRRAVASRVLERRRDGLVEDSSKPALVETYRAIASALGLNPVDQEPES